jgi:hypothetical protein
MAATFIDLTGSHHARTIIPKMNRVNKTATFLRTIFLGPFRAFEKKHWKNKPYLVLQFLSCKGSKFELVNEQFKCQKASVAIAGKLE